MYWYELSYKLIIEVDLVFFITNYKAGGWIKEELKWIKAELCRRITDLGYKNDWTAMKEYRLREISAKTFDNFFNFKSGSKTIFAKIG